MSRRTSSIAVKYKLITEDLDNFINQIEQTPLLDEESSEYPTVPINGWSQVSESEEIGEWPNIIFADGFDKPNFERIYIINEHEYANVGLYSCSAFSTSFNSLKQFAKDQGFNNYEIKQNTTIKQTL